MKMLPEVFMINALSMPGYVEITPLLSSKDYFQNYCAKKSTGNKGKRQKSLKQRSKKRK